MSSAFPRRCLGVTPMTSSTRSRLSRSPRHIANWIRGSATSRSTGCCATEPTFRGLGSRMSWPTGGCFRTPSSESTRQRSTLMGGQVGQRPERSRLCSIGGRGLSRPSLVSLRIRAIFGVGARAELIRVFLSHRHPAMTAADLSAETNYRKRNVLNELEPLRFAGVVKSFRAVNADRFSLAKLDQIEALVGPKPKRFTRWTQTFGVLHVLLDGAGRPAKRSDLQKAVEVVRLLENHKELLASARADPPKLPGGALAWPAFLDWAAGYAKTVARR